MRLWPNGGTQEMNCETNDDEVMIGLTPHETLVDSIMFDRDSNM